MAYTAFDPRDAIRTKIGTNGYDATTDREYYAITVNKSVSGEDVYIPIYDREEIKSGVQPNLPFISLALVTVINKPHNIGATVRQFIAYVDIDVAYVATSDIDIKDFGKAIKDKLHDLIRTYQASTTGVYFMNIERERYIDEEIPRQMVFHYILTLKVDYSDTC